MKNLLLAVSIFSISAFAAETKTHSKTETRVVASEPGSLKCTDDYVSTGSFKSETLNEGLDAGKCDTTKDFKLTSTNVRDGLVLVVLCCVTK